MKNEVVVMDEAIYGRRHVGKCIDVEEISGFAHDQTFLGCSTNVINLLDRKCSGRKHCDVRIPDSDLEQTQPCRKGLKMFLEASYYCAEGTVYVIQPAFC